MRATHPIAVFVVRRSRAATTALVVGCCAALGGCTESTTATAEPAANPESVWTVDLVQTLPGMQAEYLANIQANWSGARALAVGRGDVLSYRALVTPPDSLLGWDVMLLTEYADSAAWRNREAIFEEIFASPEYVRVEPARPSAELRRFATSAVSMTEVASGGGRQPDG